MRWCLFGFVAVTRWAGGVSARRLKCSFPECAACAFGKLRIFATEIKHNNHGKRIFNSR